MARFACTSVPTHSHALRAGVIAAALAGAACCLAAPATQTGQTTHVPLRSASPTSASANPTAQSKPTWAELTPAQREALAPLAPHWGSLTENHKRKWLAISRNFHTWPADEQARIHGRMSAWAGLSTTERDQARLNYNEARKLDPDEKKARWEAYQALSDEQRDKLASAVAPKRPGATVPARPVRSPTLVKLVPAGGDPRRLPRVGVPASEVDHNTLLPQHLAAP